VVYATISQTRDDTRLPYFAKVARDTASLRMKTELEAKNLNHEK
jgi:hypothetical protein